ncbi:1-acylglycerol-3-phosphate O-acyltransferase ABHD5 isoform X2 [Exaiptasia diaphana]|uniref:1-acylglycerol-3-phosphate O-acyltransferase ABHD5 n=1 Tax=Exaiptasia diaphana TaxID=2652724 RepID=A0A913WS38_EXADI|nr:1-acylglycerol-3-phosphate O-acyltransferase ABHD5 isoform X2 [Exaiptasia diaphana]
MEAVSGNELINSNQTNTVAVPEMPPSRSWFSWCPTSDRLLEYAESRILKHLKTHYEKKFVPVVKGNNVWTVKFNPSAKNIPLVMVHGFGGGLGLWALNIDDLAKNRPVYTFDLLGFGRSSRPHFSSEADMTEQEFVESIESWRKELGLEKFILLGHSLGGFLSCSYALKHPDKVKHLILVDPWGFPEKPTDDEFQARIPRWVKVLGAVLSPFNPLAGLRAAGPLGPSMVQKFRPDIQRKYESLFEEDDTILNYIYHCNAQSPSGETAFKHLSIPYGWAKFPMVNRVGNLDRRIPITFIYGARSWVDNESAYHVKDIRVLGKCIKIKRHELSKTCIHHVSLSVICMSVFLCVMPG